MEEHLIRSIESEDDGITLKELLKTVLRYRLLIGMIVFLAFVSGCVYLYFTEPIYEATGEILIASSSSSLLTDKISAQYSESVSPTSINDAIVRLRSSSIADSVIVKNAAFATIGIPREYFNKVQYFLAVPPQENKLFSIVATKQSPEADYLVISESGALIGKGKYNQRFTSPHFTIILSDLNPVTGFDIMLEPVKQMRGRVLGSLKISNIRESNAIRVSYSSSDPALSKKLVNSFMSELSLQDLQNKRAKATGMKVFLENQYKNIVLLLEDTENQYLAEKKNSGIIALDQQTSQYIDLLRYLQEKRIDYEIRLAEATVSKEKAMTVLNGDPELQELSKFASSPFIQGNDIIRELYSRVATFQVENAKLTSQYNKSHPLVQQSASQLEEARKQLDKAITSTVDNATKGIDPLLRPVVESQLVNHININVYQQLLSHIKTEIVNLNRTLDKLPKSEVDKSRFERNIGVNRQIHDLLLTRLEEARIMEAGTISDITIINWADTPLHPVAPQMSRILLLSIFAGLFLSGGLILGIEHFKPSFNSTERMERALSSPVLALIPHLSNNGSMERKILVDPDHKSDDKFETFELFNALIINLLSVSDLNSQKTIVVTSTHAQEGKSLVSANLAVALARTGKRVLLIDCDLRNPVQHNVFGIPNDCGLVEIIKHNSPKGLTKTQYPNLIFLPAGNTGEVSAPEILHDTNLIETVRKLESRFDLVIIDTPPVLLYTDAVALSNYFKNVVLVVKSTTGENAVMRSQKILTKVGARLVGVIVNDVKKSALFGSLYDEYEYGQGYGYGYGYGYAAHEKAKPGKKGRISKRA